MDLGRYGVFGHSSILTPERARAFESLGYGTVWQGGSPPADLAHAEAMLDATTTLKVATGIVNVWTADAAAVARSYHRIEAKHPGRFLLGIGVGHPEAHAEYRSPYQTLVDYLDVLDTEGVPEDRRVLAALGPRVLKLAAARTAGAHPYLVTPEHTRQAREILGPGKLLAPEQRVALEADQAKARAIGRPSVVKPYLGLTNYTSNLQRLGFSEQDVAGEGSDGLIDALVVSGDDATIARRFEEHFQAGADHVAVQLIALRGDDLEGRLQPAGPHPRVLPGLADRAARRSPCGFPVPGPRPCRAVHRGVQRSPGRRRHQGREDSAPQPARERLRGKVRTHRPGRGHRPGAHLRPTAPAVGPGRRLAQSCLYLVAARSGGRPGVEGRPADLGPPRVLVGGVLTADEVVLPDRPVHLQRVACHVDG